MRRLLASLAASALLVLPAMPAGAIVDGEPDGNGHPMVGALVAEFDCMKDWFCSGTLVSSTVFLTAGHCTAWLAEDQQVWVTFGSTFSVSGSFHPGTPFTHPAYNPRTLANDVAVVVLDDPISLTEYATLPTAGLLTDMKRDKSIDDELYVNVGYGGVVDYPPGPPMVSYGRRPTGLGVAVRRSHQEQPPSAVERDGDGGRRDLLR